MSSTRPPHRPIKRLLIANRGEIATRILNTARELSFETYTIYTGSDDSHTLNSTHALEISSPAAYLNIDELVGVVKRHDIDAVHPGYGFLSESADFSRRMWEEAQAVVVGPGWDILRRTGDKLQARMLAEECGVPVLPAMTTPTGNVEEARGFARKVGFPVMLKAVDGGGGRGIRLVRTEKDLASLAARAIEESPSKSIFIEKAAVDGYRHIEVQIIGDGTGQVEHLWERECSIQRRYQKVVEVAPSTIVDRRFVANIVAAALSMARKIKYLSLGTFEFLANPSTKQFFFLEVNPRLQVEHTITESISSVDIVKIQLEIAEGASLASTGLSPFNHNAETPPPLFSAQLRVTAENVSNDWSLSIGKLQSFHFPSGNGVRIDTSLVSGHPAAVTADFDSLIAKIIVTASTWRGVVRKAKRALQDTHIDGVRTNLNVLWAIVSSPDFADGHCDTTWLEKNISALLKNGEHHMASAASQKFFQNTTSSSYGASQGLPGSAVLFRKGDAWSINISSSASATSVSDSRVASLGQPLAHHLKLLKVLRNEFPSSLAAEVAYTTQNNSEGIPLRIELSSTTASSSQAMSAGKFRRSDPTDPHHVNIPFPGKLVEFLVDVGDLIYPGDVVCIIQQMKMELEVRAGRAGRVKWVTEAEDGEDIAEGTLAAELEDILQDVRTPSKL